jgi:dolichol-phosphate mannosyltransferase
LKASGGCQVVLGTRFSDPRSLDEWSPVRKAITHLGHFLTRMLLHIPYDASGGLRVYDLRSISMKLIESIRGTDYEFFFESVTLFDLAGLRIGEVPIKLPARAYGHSKMRIGHAVKGLRQLIVLASNLSLARRRARAAMQPEVVHND